MSSSVSSERAFSQGGITISKRRNRLKGDIVEALQCLKCLLRNDLMFRQPVEDISDDDDTGSELDSDGEQGWDYFLSDDGEDDGFDADNES